MKTNIIILLFSCILFNFFSGCSKPILKPDEIEAQRREDARLKLIIKHRSVADELEIVKGEIEKDKDLMSVYSVKMETHGQLGSRIEEEYKAKYNSAKNEKHYLEIKYEQLAKQLIELDQNIKDLTPPPEIPASTLDENNIMLKTK